jgi:hypothetical protein
MVSPPSKEGADHTIDNLALPGFASTDVGASGTVRGVADTDDEATDVPVPLVAVTLTA